MVVWQSDSQTEGTQPGTNVTRAQCATFVPSVAIPRVRTTICYCTNQLDGARLWGPPSVCHQPPRIHNGTSSKSSLLGRGEQWAVSTDRRLHFSFPNSRIRGGDNQWKCSICFMSSAEHTTEDNHFLLSSPTLLYSAHYVSTLPPTRRLRRQVIRPSSNSSRRRNAFAFACITSLLRKFASCSPNNWGIIIKNSKKVIRRWRFFAYFTFTSTRACRFSQKFNCKLVSQKADDDRCCTAVCFSCQQIIFTNSTTEKCGFLSVPGNVMPHPISQNTLRSLSLITPSKRTCSVGQ